MPRIPVGPFFAVLLAPGGGLALLVPAAGVGGLPDRRIISSRLPGGDDRVCVAAAGMEDQRCSDGERRCARIWTPLRYTAWVPGVPGQGLDPAEPVMYLSWTGDGPVMYLPYTCAGDAPDHEAAMPACGPL